MSTDGTRTEERAARLPERELQALREVGHTEIARPVALALAALFLLTLVSVPLVRPIAGGEAPWAPFAGLAAALRQPAEAAAEPDLLAANRRLIAALRAFEEGVEDGSWPRRRLLPRLQLWLTAGLGLGNEQAYPGRGGWLYYRPDVDHLTGPGFLERDVLARRARGGDAWRGPPRPDPLPALVELAGQVARHGARLVVLPTPVKPAIVPGPLAAAAPSPLRNPSWDDLRRRLAAAGITLVDPAPALAELAGERYLRTDTHWRPEAVELTARLLAEALSPHLTGSGDDRGCRRREVVVEGRGDIAAMLRLPEEQRLYAVERVSPRMVLDGAGRPWRRDPEAEVLLLGDSFSNIYSDPALGWGRGAGLAEQLSCELGRPVDKIALNAGGAHATRAALARALASGRARLAGKRVVVYQFATRELSAGDWRPVEFRSDDR